jgi:hypothetical protein
MTGHGHDETAPAVSRAEQASEAWRAAARHQRQAAADHADFHALGGEVTTTLRALDDLFGVLRRQVSAYGDGRCLYDDTGRVSAVGRLQEAVSAIEVAQTRLAETEQLVNAFWSAIGHIGVRYAS